MRIVIYNVLGQAVKELINTEHQAGIQSVTWNAKVASGIYFYRMTISDPETSSGFIFTETKKMALIK